MYSAINTEDYPSTEPVSENSNLALKMLGILGTPILFVLLSMSITMFNILCEMAEQHSWTMVWPYWMDKIMEHPYLNILLPILLCTIVFPFLLHTHRLITAINTKRK